MSAKTKRPPLHIFVAIPVACIIFGALALSGAAIMENLRFVNATTQIFGIVTEMRGAASQQKTFGQIPGEDMWADLATVGRMQGASHFNPWHGEIRGVTAAPMAVRIETDIPTHDCRRAALYLLGRQPAEMGLTGIEAQGFGDSQWTTIFPALPSNYNRAIELACGRTPYARLALIFRIR